MPFQHIDLALEANERRLKNRAGVIEGVEKEETRSGEMQITRINILTEAGASAMGKERGAYITATLPEGWQCTPASIDEAAQAIARELSSLLPPSGTALVVGLGNQLITPDSVGPLAVQNVIVTRHLLEELPQEFVGMRPVCALAPGVLGVTGIETAEIVKGVVSRVRPAVIIAIDALAALSTSRLCRTFQLSDTGITPGGGAYNTRAGLNRGTLGVPVIALGVPTVVNAFSLASDILEKHGLELPPTEEMVDDSLLVTPKDIDVLVEKSAKVIGYAINLALQGSMTVADMEQFI